MLQIGKRRYYLIKHSSYLYFYRTHVILRSVAQDGIKGQRIDFLFAFFPEHVCSKAHSFRNRYVDEVQDNLLIDAKSKKIPCHYLNRQYLEFHTVLRAICLNPDGQFWAGDTAQTISVGSSFRFDDLKAFLHRNEASYLHNFRIARLKRYFIYFRKVGDSNLLE